MDLVAAIEKRCCIRWYDGRPLPQDVVRQVVATGRDATALRPEIEIRWYTVWEGKVITDRLADAADAYEDGARYGTQSTHARRASSRAEPPALVAPPHYVIGVSKEHLGYVENLGFCMAQLVLAAAIHGLGTCWIGAMPTALKAQTSVEERLLDFVPDLGPDERIVALTPLGYADLSEPARISRQLLRWSAEDEGQPHSLQELIYQDVWGVPWVPRRAAGQRPWEQAVLRRDTALERAFGLALLAPSWANAHPWRFIVDDRRVIATVRTLFQRKAARQHKTGAAEAHQRLSGGIAMCHFHLAARAGGLLPQRNADLAPGTVDVLWRMPGSLEDQEIRTQHGIPADYSVLGVFPLPDVQA